MTVDTELRYTLFKNCSTLTALCVNIHWLEGVAGSVINLYMLYKRLPLTRYVQIARI